MVADATSPREVKSLSDLTVLVLDGDSGYRQLMASELRGLGVSSVKSTHTPQEAIEILDGPIDVLVTEYYVPFIKAIRTNKKRAIRTLPIILVTDRVRKSDVLKARDAGINAFVTKPVSASALCDHILQAVNDARPIVASQDFTGPDRRHHTDSEFSGPERRQDQRAKGEK